MAVCFAVFSPRLKSYSVYSGPKPPIKSNKFSGRYILRVKRLKRIKGIKTMLRSSGARRDTSVRDNNNNNNNYGIYIAHFHMLNTLYNTLRGT